MHPPSQGHADLLQLLLAKGADPTSTDGKGRSALHLAAAGNFDAIVGLLLDSGAPLNVRAKGGVTPLLAAAKAGGVAALSKVVEAGAAVSNQVCEQTGRSGVCGSSRKCTFMMRSGVPVATKNAVMSTASRLQRYPTLLLHLNVVDVL